MKRFVNGVFIMLVLLLSACDQSNELHPVQVLNLERGWAKTSVNAAIFRKNSVVSNDRFQYVAWYDSSGYVAIGKRALNSTDWEIVKTGMKGNVYDAHNIISIMVDGEGYIHVAWDHHNGPLNYCKSTEPGKLEFTNRLSMIGTQENEGVTYPEFYKLPNGDLLFAYRYGASGQGNLVLNKYDTKKQKWMRIHDNLIDGEGQRNAYWQMCVDKNGKIHLSWVWRETWDVFTNHDLCYATSNDGGKSWKTSKGEVLNIPITAENAEYALHIPQGSSLINQTSITADDEGRPYIVSYWTPKNSDVPQFFLVYQNGEGWNVSQITNRKVVFSLKGGGSRRIPVSRPQVVFSGEEHSVHVIYRDKEQQNRICISSAKLNDTMHWKQRTVPGIEVGHWEPSYDTEMWQCEEKLNLFVQNVGQGEGNENPEEMDSQMVKILVFENL
jgi:hypothetical protein